MFLLVSFLPTIQVWRGLHPSIRRSIRSRGRYTITDITQAGNTDLQFGGLFGRDIYRLRSSLFGYSVGVGNIIHLVCSGITFVGRVICILILGVAVLRVGPALGRRGSGPAVPLN